MYSFSYITPIEKLCWIILSSFSETDLKFSVSFTPRERIVIHQLPGASCRLSSITKTLSEHSDLTYIFTLSIEGKWQPDGQKNRGMITRRADGEKTVTQPKTLSSLWWTVDQRADAERPIESSTKDQRTMLEEVRHCYPVPREIFMTYSMASNLNKTVLLLLKHTSQWKNTDVNIQLLLWLFCMTLWNIIKSDIE